MGGKAWVGPVASLLLTAAGFATWFWSGEGSLLAGDASLFYYIGQQIGAGVAPYREIWDHKPPLLFDLTAFGVWLTPGRAWGVWAVALLLQAAGWACFHEALRRLCGARMALAGQAAGVLGMLCLLATPNMTESFALGLQGIILGMAWIWPRQWKAALAAGLAAGALFQLRANNAAAMLFWLGWVAWELRDRPRAVVGLAMAAGFGFVTAAGLLLAPLVRAGLWPDYLEAAFQFNMLYSTSPLTAKAAVALKQLENWRRLGLLPLAAAGAAAAWSRGGAWRTAAVGLLLWTGIEWAAGAVSAKLYHHYTVTMLVPAAGLIGLLGTAWPGKERPVAAVTAAVWVLTGIAACTLLVEASRGVRYRFTELASTELLQAAEAEAGPVLPLSWGLMPRDLWFRLNRPPATAIFHTTSFHGDVLYRRLVEPMLDGFLLRTPPLAIVRQGHEFPLFAEDKTGPAMAVSHAWDTPAIALKKRTLAGRYIFWRRIGPYFLFRGRDCCAL